MPNCVDCGSYFPFTMKIDGRVRNLASRKRCLSCSPFGKHNTKPVKVKGHSCSCGETNPDNFYGHKKTVCKKCHLAYTSAKNKENREFIREHLGGVCVDCGFDGPTCCFDAHHPDPSIKDPDFIRIRNWSKPRILKEISKCVLLCRNCHAIRHYASGELE